jgi:diadenosine tetraphosphate (Ap4A) HIT family hydrolase
MPNMTTPSCPFCQLAAADIVAENAFHVVIRDRFPVAAGHSLIIPKRHVASLFELTAEAFSALHDLLHSTREQLDAQYQPAGYNIGVNVGAAAGQTVFHLHVHVIPRYAGDCADPRGGVRWVLPEKAVYWD